MPGSGGLALTGRLGEAMQESAHVALSWLRANAERYGVNGHPKLNDPEQIVDRNILGSGIGHRQAKASPDERARSRRQGRQPREAGAERSEVP